MNTQVQSKNKSTPPQIRKRTKKTSERKVVDVRVTNANYSARPSGSRSGILTFESGRPFWMMVPIVLWSFIRICFLPFMLIKGVVETALSALMLAIFAGIGAWALGWVSNPQAADFLLGLGDRALELARLVGLPY
jgi:hypothetical protein